MSSNYTITIKCLVMVDSAGFCCVEIPLDEYAILLAEGNASIVAKIGKTVGKGFSISRQMTLTGHISSIRAKL
jgi:hypothetical protein